MRAFLVIAVVVWSLPVHAGFRRVGQPIVRFYAVGPVGMKIEGIGHELNLSDDGQDLTIEVPLANLKTGISLRDKHMREKYLETHKYPTATLVVPLKKLNPKTRSGTAIGTFTLHGRTRSMRFSYSVVPRAKHLGITGSIAINLRQFNIQTPSYMGVTLKPDVDVKVSFNATQYH